MVSQSDKLLPHKKTNDKLWRFYKYKASFKNRKTELSEHNGVLLTKKTAQYVSKWMTEQKILFEIRISHGLFKAFIGQASHSQEK